MRKTETITKRIQELLISAQDSNHDLLAPCSEQITMAVSDMAQLFPKVRFFFVGTREIVCLRAHALYDVK